MRSITLGTLGLITAGLVMAAPNEVKLPADVSTLRPSNMPGYAIAQQKCGICHSADYISFQPPGMDLKAWIGEMSKMQHSYGAPITDNEVKAIGAYLAVTYGSAKRRDPAVMAVAGADAPAKASATATGGAIDVQPLLVSNNCTVCHAADKRIVGPSFQEVSAKYKGDAAALATVSASIRAGGVGKWGQTPMPPMSLLNPEQAKALAAYVLKQ